MREGLNYGRKVGLTLIFMAAVAVQAWAGDSAGAQTVVLDVDPGQVITQNFQGLGAQGDFFLTLDINRQRGVDARDLELIRRRVEAMRPRILRTFFDYEWWEPEEGRQTPQSAPMRDYVEWLRFLQSIGCKVILNPWGDNFAYSAWMMPDYDQFPKEASESTLSRYPKLPVTEKARDAVARSLADLVKYLKVKEGLSNVEYLCLMNEPDNDYKRPVEPAQYVSMVKRLDRELRDRGLRKEIVLLGPDDCACKPDEPGPFFRATAAPLAGVIDAMASHSYVHTPDNLNLLPAWIQRRMKLEAEVRPAAPPRPLLITEFGWPPAGQDAMKSPEAFDRYEYGLFLGDFAIVALREGAAAVLMWDLLDTWYPSEGRGEFINPWGLWHYRDAGWRAKPGFYAWSLLTRYTEPGSRVVAVKMDPPTDAVHATALISPAGKMTLLLANRDGRPLKAHLATGLKRNAVLRQYLYAPDRIPTRNGEMIGASGTLRLCADRPGELELPAKALAVLSELE